MTARLLSTTALALVLVAGLPTPAPAAEDPEALIRQGNDLRRRGEDSRAHGYLKRAYELARTPRSAAQLALVEQAVGQFADAEIHFSEALASKDAWVQEHRASLEAGRAFVRSKLAKIEIAGAPADATVAVGGESPIKLPRDGVIWLAPGQTTLVIEAPGYKGGTRSVTVKVGDSLSLPADLASTQPAMTGTPPAAGGLAASDPGQSVVPVVSTTQPADQPPAPGGRARVAGIALAGGGVALGVTGFILRGVASSKIAAIERDASTTNPQPYNENNGNWKTYDGAGLAFMATGAAAVVVGATLYIVNRPTQAEPQVAFSLVPLDGGGHLQISGRY